MLCLAYTPPGITNLHFIPPCAAELYEVFDSLTRKIHEIFRVLLRLHGVRGNWKKFAILCSQLIAFGIFALYPDIVENFTQKG